MSAPPPKRQMIKTRPQRPYFVARIVLVIIALAAIALVAFEVSRGHAGHALGPTRAALGSERVTLIVARARTMRQEALGPARSTTVQFIGAIRS